ncbi:MAG: exo-alpha-sialidase [Clostridia bacterium]|nr:exo-alpha-sialidase [Clostridia bacterium]
MKIILHGQPETVMSNPLSKHNYFGWPTVARLKNGKIAVVASGYRLRHICPFGKMVISYSEDEGKTYTAPAPLIDTTLDDRDGGIMTFGDSGVLVASFNNTRAFQRSLAYATPYDLAYLDRVTDAEEARDLGSTFRISTDNGVTFGPIFKAPVTSPHGPLELSDGTLLWVGRKYSCNDTQMFDDKILAFKVDLDGGTEYVGEIANVTDFDFNPLSCEPHTVQLDDGTLLTHIRVQNYGDNPLFTVYQSESRDMGKTWSKPIQLLPQMGGSPPHILKHSSGMLVCTYGYREAPFGVKAMFSRDNGKTWDYGYDIYVNGVSGDLGYPSSIELADGSILTVFYAHPSKNEPALILQQRWSFSKD